MKIAISGKGGTGKTFLAANLAVAMARRGRPVLAIDADPSPGLAPALGLSPDESGKITPIAENADLIQLKTGTDYAGVFRLTFTVDDLIRKFGVATPAGVPLLVMGTVKAAGSGCNCPAHSVVRALFRHLLVDRSEYVIMDMEAGIEHLGRGTAEHVDLMIIVADANRRSLEIAGSIAAMAAGSSIRRIGLVGNRIAGTVQEGLLRGFAQGHGIPLLAIIPFDPGVTESGITGDPVAESSPAVTAIFRLAEGIDEGSLPGTASGGGAE